MPSLSLPAEDSATLLDVRAVAVQLHCSPRHVYRLVDAGLMPAPIKLGALVRFDRARLVEWIAAGCPRIRTVSGREVRP